MILPNWLYDLLKWIAILALPATKVAIPRLFEIWHWPYGAEIGETLDTVAVWLGTIVGISCATYKAEPEETSIADLKKAFDVEDGDHQAEAEDDTNKG